MSAGVALAAVITAAQPVPERYDVIVRNGTVLDGAGTPRYRADVAIAGGSIARVGTLGEARAAVRSTPPASTSRPASSTSTATRPRMG